MMRGACTRLLVLSLLCLLAVSGLAAQDAGGQADIGAWSFSGDYTPAGTGTVCGGMLPAGGFALGYDPATCDAILNGGTATVPVRLPANAGQQVVTLTFTCPDDNCARHLGVATCTSVATGSTCLTPLASDGDISVMVDGEPLWRAGCDEMNECDFGAVGKQIQAVFVTDQTDHEITLHVPSNRALRIAGLDVQTRAVPDLIQGIAYSPFRDCQNPNWGPFPTYDQIEADMRLVRNMGNSIRTYASTGVQGQIATLARQAGLRVMAGAALGRDLERNEAEIAALINLVQTADVEAAIVGNEVMLREDMAETQLIDYIERVKAAVDVPVTTAEIGSTMLKYPAVMEAVEFVMPHLYAYWDAQPIENAARYVVDRYREIQAAAGGKRVIIGETGWPSGGWTRGAAVPGPENQRRFLREFLTLAQEQGIEFYYFSGFDELWKTPENGVGPYWGMLHADRRNKYDVTSVLAPMHETLAPYNPQIAAPAPTGTPGAEAAAAYAVYTNYGMESNTFTPNGWMGDLDTIAVNDCARLGTWGDRAIEILYDPSRVSGGNGWAGVYWLYPEGNWGTIDRSLSLSGFTQVRFRARATVHGAWAKFFVGGVNSGPYPSSIPQPLYPRETVGYGWVQLTTDWQEFHISLAGADLSHVIDGFGWTVDTRRAPAGVRIYVDDIVYE